MKHRSRLQVGLAVTGVLLGTMLQAVDGSIVNVAIPQIQRDLGASLATVGWVVTGYALASLIAMPLSAGVAARVGVRGYFVGQVAAFTLASAACASSRSAAALIAFRVLQGFSAGGLLPLSQGILMSLYPGERRGTAVALVGFAAVLGPLFGPPLGGALTDRLGWSSIFWINVPLGLASLLLLRNLHLEPVRRGERMDLRGAVLLAAAVVSLQLGCAHRAWLLLPAGVLGWLFVRRERATPSPAVDLSVLRYRPLAGTLAAAPLYGVGLYASIFLIPLLFERQLSMTAEQTGIALAAGAVASSIVIVSAQPLLTRFRARSLCAVGAVMFAVSMLLLARIAHQSAGDVYLPQVLRGAGTGLLYVGMNGFAFEGIDGHDLSTAASLFYVLRQLGGTIGVALSATALDAFGGTGTVGAFGVLAVAAPLSLLPMISVSRQSQQTDDRARITA
ncbi:MAG TPA: DHA2 family efflux MFS transporter permease subunit [Myxococcales bacterium]|nr:DHA2 family efflux MFS transporter permease subunit [Myxococcales bacterium]